MSGDVADNMAPFLLLGAFRGLIDELHSRLAANGFADVRALYGMAMQAIGGGCTATELARRLGVSKQAAAKTAQTLGSLGLVRAETNPRDRRERRLVPTERGRLMLVESGRILSELVRAWRDTVGDREIDVTLRTLASIDHGRRSMTDVSDWL